MSKRPRVAIVFGGVSSEHAVSCLTAASVVRALDRTRYDVVGVGIAPDGTWRRFDAESIAELALTGRQLPQVPSADPDPERAAQLEAVADQPHEVRLPELGGVDVALTLLHGPFGEDGTIQGLFEMLGVRYVGSGVMASAAGMDKHYMKQLLTAAGIRVAPYVVITDRQWRRDSQQCLETVRGLEFPLFIKPARGGSSMGISKVEQPDQLRAAIEQARRYDPKVVVEQGLVGARELECGVLEIDGELRASVVGEVTVHSASGFYDFAAKYVDAEVASLQVPADCDADLVGQVQQQSIAAFTALGCEGLARVDFFCDQQGGLYCNEVNTMPGFTEHSMFPKLWASSGVEYPELIDTLLRSAFARPMGLR